MNAESYTLGRIGPSGLGLTSGPTTDDVLVTVQGDGVLQYSVSKKRNKCGWALGAAKSFSCPAVFNTNNETYYAACSSGPNLYELMSWKQDLVNLELDKLSPRLQLPKPVHSIHPTSCSPRHVEDSEEEVSRENDEEGSTSGCDKEGVFIVFTDGEVALNGFYYNGQRNYFVGQKGQVLATSCHRGRLVVAALLETHTCEIAVYSLKDGYVLKHMQTTIQTPLNSILMSLSIRGQALSILWSEGTLQTFNLFPDESDNLTLRLQCTRKLSGFEAETNIVGKTPKNGKRHSTKRKSNAIEQCEENTQALIVTVPGSLVAMLNWKTDESASHKRLKVTILDSMYGTVRRVENLPVTESLSPLKNHILQAAHLGSETQQLAVLAGGSVILTPIEDAPPALATLVGSLSFSQTGQQQQAARSAFHKEEWQKLHPNPGKKGRPSWLPSEITDIIAENPTAILAPIETRESDASEPDESAQLISLSTSICNLRSFDSENSASKLVDKFLAKARQKDGLHVFSDEIICLLYLRLSEKGYWDDFRKLHIVAKIPSLSSCGDMLPRMLEAEQYTLLNEILPLVNDVPASCLEESLKLILTSTISQDQDGVLCQLMKAQIDEGSILQALQNLDISSVLQLASSLVLKLQGLTGVSESREKELGLQITECIKWSNCLIDAQLIGLSNSTKTPEIVRELKKILSSLTEGNQIITPLLSIVKQIRARAPMPGFLNDTSSLYVVELLDLSVS